MGDWSVKDQAIYNTHPNVVEIIDSKDCFDKDGKPVTLDDTKVATELARLQAEYDSREYARKRKAEYDQLNQFEMMFDDKRDGTTTWVDAINAIKARHPKS